MVAAAEAVCQHDRRRAARLYAEAAWPAMMANRIPEALDIALRGEAAHDPGERPSLQTLATAAAALVLAGRPREALIRVELAERLPAAPGAPWDDLHRAMLAHARTATEGFDVARSAYGAIVDRARRSGAPWILALGLAARAEVDWWTGHWASAAADAAEGLRWGDELGQTPASSYALTVLARIDAARGDFAGARRRMDRVVAEAGSRGLDCFLVYSAGVLGLAELSAGDVQAATHHLDRAWRIAKDAGLDSTNVAPFGGDLAEAHMRAGDGDRALEVLEWLDERADATGLVFPAAVAARCRGMLAADAAGAEQSFATAHSLLVGRQMPFDLGRTLLAEGETLRRFRRPAAARPVLREALTLFDALGARPWSGRAEAELAACGDRRIRRAADGGLGALTPQEFQIARAVAGGSSNVEVAEALFVSRKTVEAHLTRVYRKLGIRSRMELVRMLASRPYR